MKILIFILLIVNVAFCKEDCVKLKKLHDKFYKGYLEFDKQKKEINNILSEDYLNKSILMGLLAGDCLTQLNNKEEILTIKN